MEVHIDKRAVRAIRQSAADAIEEGDTEALREDIYEAFSEEQVEEIEQQIGSGDFLELLTDVLDEWGGDDVDELFELLETQLADQGVDLKYRTQEEDEEVEDDLLDREEDEVEEADPVYDADELEGDDEEEDDDEEEGDAEEEVDR
ncbi:MAG: hypothetical protein IT373_00660 [Polyangiaceae bacterium]|nr:hypothetical protein [Polyangiaceae bacterium]